MTTMRRSASMILTGPTHFKMLYFTIITSVILFTGAVVYRSIDNRAIISDVCGQVNAMKSLIRQSAEDQLKIIPTITYYREHPDEMEKALNQVQVTIKRFQEINCGN